MDLYSTVFASLACESCGADSRTDVQFYTDDDGAMPQYEVGQVVAALKPASTYEGIAGAFCGPCMARWQADENEANFEALAIAIEAGEIVARFATYRVARARFADGPVRSRPPANLVAEASRETAGPLQQGPVLTILREAPLTPTEARDLANLFVPGSLWGSFGARLVDARVVLFRDGARLQSSPEPWWTVHHARVGGHLAKKGWRPPAGTRTRDLVVLVGSDGRIDVKPIG